MARIGIIGSGCGYEVNLFDKEPQICAGISGKFGIRIHKGPHYPRSPQTRASCQATFERFCAQYSDLVMSLEHSIYALGETTFDHVCRENTPCREVSSADLGLENLKAAYDLDEPCAVLNPALRDYFMARLTHIGVKLYLGAYVTDLKPLSFGIEVCLRSGERHMFDRIINATAYTSLLPDIIHEDPPIAMTVVYQVCIAFEYLDLQPGDGDISFIVMDGWFPCLMPVFADKSSTARYVLTHACHTNLATFERPDDAQAFLSHVKAHEIERTIKQRVEQEISRFWPSFLKRFQYCGFRGEIMAKLRTEGEFRSSFVFERDKIIYAGEEVAILLNQETHCGGEGYKTVDGGVMDRSRGEIEWRPTPESRNTGYLQPYKDWASM
ncbi:hypothetical protein BDV59DRAFT_196939 [Aspergillus ambiguus]|uniref:uncharacterized protein n=1 Tax=Aspergillus ambiguus TaxID=176160 RepID=UPI003CCD5B49